jgi:FO synthase
LRREVSGDVVRYVVNRNINYTNICGFRCRFCAFSKGKTHDALRGVPYNLELEEIVRRAREAWSRGATEVCLQGGIHPSYTGATYLAICRAIKGAVPAMHIHAFSPLEIFQGAATIGMDVPDFLGELMQSGLGSLPGTAAEILDDSVREVICPDKLSTAEWLSVVGSAHRVGLRTTATIMYGHVERPIHWARHLLAIRDLQAETGGFTEFVPLPFVHMEAPLYLRGDARKGPTLREAVLMHAVARLVFHTLIPNIQTSWVKMGAAGVAACLNAGANDLGGTLMNESISRAAGTQHGQELPPDAMEELIRSCARVPQQRLTTYHPASAERRSASFRAPPLLPCNSIHRKIASGDAVITTSPASLCWAERDRRGALFRLAGPGRAIVW